MESFAPYRNFSGNISGLGREPMPNVYLPNPDRRGKAMASGDVVGFSANGYAGSGSMGTIGDNSTVYNNNGYGRSRPNMNMTQAFSSSAPVGHGQPHVVSGPRPINNMNMGGAVDGFGPGGSAGVDGFGPGPRPGGCEGGVCNNSELEPMRGRYGMTDSNGAGGGEQNAVVFKMKKNMMKLMNQLQSKPNWADLSTDGGALWKYGQLVAGNSIWCRVFNRIEIGSDRYAYTKPIPYYARLTTVTKIKLDRKVANQIMEMLPQVGYCGSDNTLRITMDSLEHNLAILAIVCGIQQGKLKMCKVKKFNLIEKYLYLTTPRHPKYNPYAKYSLIKFIRSGPSKPKKKRFWGLF